MLFVGDVFVHHVLRFCSCESAIRTPAVVVAAVAIAALLGV